MVYSYKCDKCGKYEDIDKHNELASKTEYCKECNNVLTRVWSSPTISTGDGTKS